MNAIAHFRAWCTPRESEIDMSKTEMEQPQAAPQRGRRGLLCGLVFGILAMVALMSGTANATPTGQVCAVDVQNLDHEAAALSVQAIQFYCIDTHTMGVQFEVLKDSTPVTFSSSDAHAGFTNYGAQVITNVTNGGSLSAGRHMLRVKIPSCTQKVQVDLTTGVAVHVGGVPQFDTHLIGGANILTGTCEVLVPARPMATADKACVTGQSAENVTLSLSNSFKATLPAIFTLKVSDAAPYQIVVNPSKTVQPVLSLLAGQTVTVSSKGLDTLVVSFDAKCVFTPPVAATPKALANGECVTGQSLEYYNVALSNGDSSTQNATFSLTQTGQKSRQIVVRPGHEEHLRVALTKGQTVTIASKGLDTLVLTFDVKCVFTPPAPPQPQTPAPPVHKQPVHAPSVAPVLPVPVASPASVPLHFGSGTGGQALALLNGANATPAALAPSPAAPPTVASLGAPLATGLMAAHGVGFNWTALWVLLASVLLMVFAFTGGRRTNA